MVKIKVCGITNLADAERALELGADALGFNFYAPSPRFIAPEKARAILRQLPRGSCTVALFVNEPRDRVEEVLRDGGTDGERQLFSCLQFHGEESGEYCRGWAMKVIKAFRVKGKESLGRVTNFPADFYLLDSWSSGYGGSGGSFPWEWVEGIDTARLFLSGGLSVGNVAEAVRRVRPYGVDVCSGVEAYPGIKDYAKLQEFIIAAKSA